MNTLHILQKQLAKFNTDRDWDQFHNPKELAIGISTEANELLDIFRFKTNEQMVKMFQDSVIKVNIEDEIADVLFFILRFAQMNHLDLEQCLNDKLIKNAKKYPVDKIKGKNLKYTEI